MMLGLLAVTVAATLMYVLSIGVLNCVHLALNLNISAINHLLLIKNYKGLGRGY